MNRTKYIIGGIIIILLLGVSFWGYAIFNTYTLKEYVVDTPIGSFTINTNTGMEQLLLPLHLLILAFIAWNVICADHLRL